MKDSYGKCQKCIKDYKNATGYEQFDYGMCNHCLHSEKYRNEDRKQWDGYTSKWR